MTKFQNRLYQGLLFLGDSLLFFVSLGLAYLLRKNDISFEIEDFLPLAYAFTPIWILSVLSYFVATLYEVPSLVTTINRVKMIMRLHVVALVFGLAYFYIFPDFFGVTPKVILLLQIVIYTVLAVVWRVYASHHIRTKKKRKALLVGQGAVCNELKQAVNDNPQSLFMFVEHIEVHSPLLADTTLESLRAVLRENEITLLVVDVKSEKVLPLLPYFYNLVSDGVRIYDINKMYEDVFKKTPLNAIGYFWFFENVTLDMRLYEIAKRGVDLLLSIPVTILFLISLPFVWLANRVEGEGDGTLFSKQKRLGLGGKVIEIYKYRTMLYTDSGNWRMEGNNKNRDTKVGAFLRRTNIDELPQVINIIKGQMSFIGPRNDVITLGEKLHKEIPYYVIRYSIKPGISGWAQTLQKVKNINPQGIEENINRFQYDLYYIKNRSLLLDVIIILRTIRILLIRLGI
ncbi:MAG: sugar transferase [Candidatus Pacebacteria bacterium]|nr:sugar transferase [Candidatus Paceibacterota bacterium]